MMALLLVLLLILMLSIDVDVSGDVDIDSGIASEIDLILICCCGCLPTPLAPKCFVHLCSLYLLFFLLVCIFAVCGQVYDLMTKLAELAVTSHRPTLRATAGQTFLTFVLQYPLGEKRLQFHLNQVRQRSFF